MKKIDITKNVIQARQQLLTEEQQKLDSMTLPSWMQTPFDEYFYQAPDNVVSVDFQQAFHIPKALAASSVTKEKTPWYDQGLIAFKDQNGAILNIIFNKASQSDTIDITVTVTDGDSVLLNTLAGNSDVCCSIYDKETELAKLTASVNLEGNFMYAEGVVLETYEPADSDQYISLKFH